MILTAFGAQAVDVVCLSALREPLKSSFFPP